MNLPSKETLADAGERVFWTAAAAVVGTSIVVIADWDPLLVAVVTPVLTTLKVWVATHVQDKGTAAIRLRRKS